MSATRFDWTKHGFAGPPALRVGPAGGLLVYRCWGCRTFGVGASEWGSGYFSASKPRSVLEAEMRFNILDWDNGINFVSTFRLRGGFGYWQGHVAHEQGDDCLSGSQIYVEAPLQVKMELVISREVLKHDVSVGPDNGHA